MGVSVCAWAQDLGLRLGDDGKERLVVREPPCDLACAAASRRVAASLPSRPSRPFLRLSSSPSPSSSPFPFPSSSPAPAMRAPVEDVDEAHEVGVLAVAVCKKVAGGVRYHAVAHLLGLDRADERGRRRGFALVEGEERRSRGRRSRSGEEEGALAARERRARERRQGEENRRAKRRPPRTRDEGGGGGADGCLPAARAAIPRRHREDHAALLVPCPEGALVPTNALLVVAA